MRQVVEELGAWHARALKAEQELKEAEGAPARPARSEPETRGRVSELEQENKQLRQRLETARVRVSELLARLTFLEDQAREQAAHSATSRTTGAA